MQVAKFWRRNQLRYRLQGLAQPKAQIEHDVEPVKVADNSTLKVDEIKVKVA